MVDTALPRLPELGRADHSQSATLLKFLSTTLVLKVQNLLRKQIRRNEVAADRSDHGDDDGGDDWSDLAAETRGVVTHAIRRETGAQVAAAIQALAPADRAVIVLRAIEQNSNEETATILGESPNAVSLRYNRAIQKLAARLPESLFGDM